MGLSGPFVGGVQAHLGAQPGHGGGEIQVVDRRVVDHDRVPHGVHTGGDGPDHVFPVTGVDIVVGDDHELGVHELAQERPYPHHHPFGMARVLLFHGHYGHSIGAALRWQVEVPDV